MMREDEIKEVSMALNLKDSLNSAANMLERGEIPKHHQPTMAALIEGILKAARAENKAGEAKKS